MKINKIKQFFCDHQWVLVSEFHADFNSDELRYGSELEPKPHDTRIEVANLAVCSHCLKARISFPLNVKEIEND